MRTSSLPHPAVLVALAFLSGWLSASMLTPPVAISQVAPRREAPPSIVDPVIPALALDAVVAPSTPPSGRRNPFAFDLASVTPHAEAARRRALTADPGDAAPALAANDSAMSDVPPAPPTAWKVSGIASDAASGMTAVLTGAGVVLARAGDRLPDGAEVVDVTAAVVTLRLANGTLHELRFQ
jgi:hypothetical protein